MSAEFRVIDHPLVQHKMSYLRMADTTTDTFRRLVREITAMLAYEVTRDLQTELIDVTTPITTTQAPVIAGKKLCLVSILRAGNGMLDGMIDLLPAARVGHVGMYRDPETLKPVEYYCKLPGDISERDVILLDPMLATGGSAVAAIDMMKKRGVKNIKFMCLVAAPEGVEVVNQAHPDVPIFTASLDRQLNEHKYILPGLGDAGDRIFGTK